MQSLTPREQGVLALVKAGFTNAEITVRLVLNEGTAKAHLVPVLFKLGARNRVHTELISCRVGIVVT